MKQREWRMWDLLFQCTHTPKSSHTHIELEFSGQRAYRVHSSNSHTHTHTPNHTPNTWILRVRRRSGCCVVLPFRRTTIYFCVSVNGTCRWTNSNKFEKRISRCRCDWIPAISYKLKCANVLRKLISPDDCTQYSFITFILSRQMTAIIISCWILNYIFLLSLFILQSLSNVNVIVNDGTMRSMSHCIAALEKQTNDRIHFDFIWPIFDLKLSAWL